MIVRASAWRAYSARSAGSRVSAARSPIASRIVPRSRIETPSRSSVLEHPLDLADPELVGHDLLDGGGVLLLERVEQLLRLLAREQLVGVAADRLGQVGDDRPTRRRRPCSRAPRPRRGRRPRSRPRAGRRRARRWGCRRCRATASPGFIARRWPGTMRARATSLPRTLRAYSCESSVTSSWMRTGAITMPSSAAIWRRTTPTRASSVPPACWSTSGTRPKPIVSSSGSIGERLERGVAGAARRSGARPPPPRRRASRSSWAFIARPSRKKQPPRRGTGAWAGPGRAPMTAMTPPAIIGARGWPQDLARRCRCRGPSSEPSA